MHQSEERTFTQRLKSWQGVVIPLLWTAVLLLVSPLHDTFEEWDGAVQLLAGQELVSGSGYTGLASHRWPPLYALLSGLGARLIPGFEAAKMVSILASIALLYVAYRLTRALSGSDTTAVLVQCFLIVNPTYFISAIQAENHMLDSLFFVSALLLLLQALRQPSFRKYAILRMLSGLACLSRYTSHLLIPLSVLSLFLVLGRKRAAIASATVLWTFALVSLPWWIENTRANGSPFANMLYLNLNWRAFGSNPKWWWSTQANFGSALRILTAGPLGYLENIARNVYSSARILVATAGALAPFVVPAAFDSTLSMQPRVWVTLFAGLAVFTAAVSQALVFNEIFLSWMIILSILSAMFLKKYLGQLADLYPVLRKFRLAPIVIGLLLLGGLAFTAVGAHRYFASDDYDGGQMADYRQVTAALSDYDPMIETAQVMAVHPARSYYLNAGYLPLPLYYEGSVDGIVSYRGVDRRLDLMTLRFPSSTPIEDARADYLVYDDSARAYLPQFAFLFDPGSSRVPDNFRLVYKSPQVVVYHILWHEPAELDSQ